MGAGLWLLQIGKVHLAGNPAFSLTSQSPSGMRPVGRWMVKQAMLGTNTSTEPWVHEGRYGDALNVEIGGPVPSFWAVRGLSYL